MPPGYSRGIGQTVSKGAVTTMAAETPTIVLVHGAWADATGFDAEIRALQAQGFRAIGFANPLRDLAGDASYLRVPGDLTGPIVIVGHYYAAMSSRSPRRERQGRRGLRQRLAVT